MDSQDQDIEISRSGYYTVTFENTSCLSEEEIRKELGTIGEICAVIWKKNRIFVRYKHKDEAQRAITKYGKILKVQAAFNSKKSGKPQQERGSQESVGGEEEENDDGNNDDEEEEGEREEEEEGEREEEEEEEEEDLEDLEKKISSIPKSNVPETNTDSENCNNSHHEEKCFCLILSNLPKKFIFKDIKALIEETNPLWVELDETKVFNIRFAYVILDSLSKMTYLIEKLNGFVICGEKLRAVEVNELLEWRFEEENITA